MNVSVVIPTRGNVDLMPVAQSIPDEWEIVVYNNGAGEVKVMSGGEDEWVILRTGLPNLAVYARYAAIEYASHDLVVTQDDDVIVSDPQAIGNGLVLNYGALTSSPFALAPGGQLPPVTHVQIAKDRVVCNMPTEFRHDGYTDSALVGFGAAFHRDAPKRAFQRWWQKGIDRDIGGVCMPGWGIASPTFIEAMGDRAVPWRDPFFQRTCDVVFTTLTDRVLVDVPKTNREFAEDPDRMYRQPGHVGERARMLELARQARDAT